ncbi:MAG: tRNA pseudouridine(55) synthase TruB [Treponema sp.]|jgi:tRNA pseudouridine55 synthase|nr:tRNA pseudouridine(55) synthase TruB [Treponema sp.]
MEAPIDRGRAKNDRPGIPAGLKTRPCEGCLLLNKNPGRTSFESLFPVKKAFATGKVCHTGTLDKFARGLLVVLAGPAVKLASRFSGCDKRYRATVKFGEETDTLDPEGAVIAAGPVPERAALEDILPRFTGGIMQAPPLFSAVHVDGVRAYKLARSPSLRPGVPAGGSAKLIMKERPVTIYSLELLDWTPPLAELEVRCSAGTYIRSLARDIALALGSRAHLLSLTRTAVGSFSLDEAVSVSGPEDAGQGSRAGFESEPELESLRKALIPLNPELFARLGISCLDIGEKEAAAVSHGGSLRFLEGRAPEPPGSAEMSIPPKPAPLISAALFHGGSLAALVEKKNGVWSYGYVASGHSTLRRQFV